MLRAGAVAAMPHITSRQNSLVSRYRALAAGTDKSRILIDGVHLLTDAIDARVPLLEAAVRLDVREDDEIRPLVDRLVALGVDVCTATPRVMEVISPVRSASPIVAIARRPAAGADVYTPPPALVVCAVNVQDPGNVGALVRVAEAGSATGAVIAGQSADPFGWKALRGSMGSALRLPIQYPAQPGPVVDEARRLGCRVWALTPRGGRSLEEANLSEPALVLTGGEGPGLPDGLVETADARISIPMTPSVESLNTAVCAALVVYEARRQRQSRGLGGYAGRQVDRRVGRQVGG
jgi:TrmH family RNA methyltransferase